jgi:hypothetical protein
MIGEIQRMGDVHIIIVDNASTYPPLLEWYVSAPCEVVMLKDNLGPRAPWTSGVISGLTKDVYIVTDPDLDLSGLPANTIAYLDNGLSKPGVWKVGLSLRLDDLPNTSIANAAKNWEQRFWGCYTGDGYYVAPVDTTFALYNRKTVPEDIGGFINGALRAAPPYSARHLPWYLTPDTVTEEEKHYLSAATCGTSGSFWNQSIKNILGV